MIFKKLLVSVFLTTFVSSVTAAKSFPLLFEELDTDANAYISKAEAKVRKDLEKNFNKIDLNGDGKVNITEYQAYEGKERFQPPEDTETPELGAAPLE